MKRPLLILLVLALLASTVIPALADSGKVYRLAGDFNGDGVTTPGWFTDGMFVLYGATAGGDTVRFRYGRSGDVPVVGDWKGNGRDTVGVVRNGRRWLLRDSNTSGDADRTFIYGGWLGRDRPVVGDWTGKGFDAPGVVRGSTWHLRTTLSSGNADITFTYGRVGRGDIPVAGDWTNKGRDTAGVVRSGVWHLRDSNRGGSADWIVKYGRKGDVPVVGNWDGRGGDSPGVVRGTTWMLKNTLSGGAADVTVDLADAAVAEALTEPEIVATKQPTTKTKPVAPGKPVPQPEPEEASTVEPTPSTESDAVTVEEEASQPTAEPVSGPSEEPATGGGGTSGVGTAFAALLSEDELAVQRDRMTNGPFRAAGDFSANSPGHWNEMAAAMTLDFSSARWGGPQLHSSDGRVLLWTEPHPDQNVGGRVMLGNDPPGSVRQMAHDMMSAAYAAAITGNHTVAAAITKEIEYQATRPNLNYSNRTLWPFDYYDDGNPLFMHAVWVKDYVLAYDITKAMGHSSPIVERWFLDLAELNEQIVHKNLSRVFPNRKSDSYSSRASSVDTATFAVTRSADGELVEYPRIVLSYNNRRSNQAGFYGLVGVVLDNTRYKEEFKRYMREWVMFGHRATSSDGLHGDINRGTDSAPQLGFSYGLHAMESLIPAMDGLARQGDTSLYEFSSSDGAATPIRGTNHYKTMEGVLDTYIKWIKGSYPAQYASSGRPPPTSIAGDPYYRIQSRNTGNGREIVNDASLLLPANYYNRTDWHDVIMRKGTPSGFTTRPMNVGSIGGWRADWRHRFLRSLDTDPYPTRG